MQSTQTVSKRKSSPLKTAELTKLKRFVSKQTSVTEAAELIGVPRNVLDRVLLVGSGSPENITIIRTHLAA